MKKTAILSIAAFYLLLTTGMFVCLIHCAGESVFQSEMAMQAMNHDAHHGKQHQHSTKDCDCCNKHGNYVIKENIKPATVDVQAPLVSTLPRQLFYVPITVAYAALTTLPSSYGKAPPGVSGKALSIQLRSLQI